VAFLVEALLRAKARGHTLRCRFVGNGPLRDEVAARLAAGGVPAIFDGYLQPHQLPPAYCSARVLAFPTPSDCWGLVANEAILCGTPVLSSPHAVSAIELVQRHNAGLVRELDVDEWATALISLARDQVHWERFNAACEPATRTFALDKAVSATMAAIRALQ
jgi:glycosyltransferase involved in cell wall biosynthesis